MVHQEFIEQPRDEILEQIWRRREDGDDTLAGLVSHSPEPGARRIIERLAEDRLVALEGDRVHLSQEGDRRARLLVRRNRLAERLLADVLEVPEVESERTACLMEHILSPAVTDAVCAFLGHPPTCPHGRIIPPGACCTGRGKRSLKPLVVPLDQLETGVDARIVFIAPTLHSRLDRLGSFGVVPGTLLKVCQKRPAFVIELGGTTLAMEREVGREIFVRRA
jgi:DtxR family Mn-dependent transcriptional regulator